MAQLNRSAILTLQVVQPFIVVRAGRQRLVSPDREVFDELLASGVIVLCLGPVDDVARLRSVVYQMVRMALRQLIRPSAETQGESTRVFIICHIRLSPGWTAQLRLQRVVVFFTVVATDADFFVDLRGSLTSKPLKRLLQR